MGRETRHRGPHPKDGAAFSPAGLTRLHKAAADLAWLLDRGYGRKASLELVSNRHALLDRQRQALQRAIDPVEKTERRRAIQTTVTGKRVIVDGFNVVINVEAALGGAPVVRGRDRWIRNLALVHGSYRLVAETERACTRLIEALSDACEGVWLLDRGVANSGRLAAVLRGVGAEVSCRNHVDRLVSDRAEHDGWVAATADTAILDRVRAATDLSARALATVAGTWTVDLSRPQLPK